MQEEVLNREGGASRSVWMATQDFLQYPSLTKDARAQVCIIGAGMAGLSCAYWLTRSGLSVIVVDDGPVGGGASGRTTAHLSNAFDDRYYELERLYGQQGARVVAESHTVAINRIESIVSLEKIDCDFERLDGYLFVPPEESTDVLKRELEAARRAGLVDVEWVDSTPLRSYDLGPCLRFPRQAQFHPLKYLSALAQAVTHEGGSIFCGTHAAKINGGKSIRIAVSNGHTITADHLIVATNTPINDRFAIHTKQAPYRTYVIGASVPFASIPKALYWDTQDPYHYVRLHSFSQPKRRDGQEPPATRDVLIVGGEDHKTGQADDPERRYARLEAWARERFPMIESVDYRWSGQIMEPVDYVAFIGRNPMDDDHVYIVTGDSGNGMTHGSLAGILLTDLIMGRDNPWASLYEPSRKTWRALPEFARENLNVAAQYADWITSGETSAESDIAPGEGAIVRHGFKKAAVFRDEEGELHRHSAVCPHLGCIVAWNHGEKTWDCPCHGSRYDARGKVINGPAISHLAPWPEKEDFSVPPPSVKKPDIPETRI